jgi:hypothetical protein
MRATDIRPGALNGETELKHADISRFCLGVQEKFDALCRVLACDQVEDAALRLGVDRLIPRGHLAQDPALGPHALDAEELPALVPHIALLIPRPVSDLVQADQVRLELDGIAQLLALRQGRRRILRLDPREAAIL